MHFADPILSRGSTHHIFYLVHRNIKIWHSSGGKIDNIGPLHKRSKMGSPFSHSNIFLPILGLFLVPPLQISKLLEKALTIFMYRNFVLINNYFNRSEATMKNIRRLSTKIRDFFGNLGLNLEIASINNFLMAYVLPSTTFSSN